MYNSPKYYLNYAIITLLAISELIGVVFKLQTNINIGDDHNVFALYIYLQMYNVRPEVINCVMREWKRLKN